LENKNGGESRLRSWPNEELRQETTCPVGTVFASAPRLNLLESTWFAILGDIGII